MLKIGFIGNTYRKTDLAAHIWRKRPKGSGSKKELVNRLVEKMDALAKLRWERVCKGQRRPTPKQALEMANEIATKVEESQKLAKRRTVGVQDVINSCRAANSGGTDSRNGGTVTAASYGYRWETTKVFSKRVDGGNIECEISRSSIRTLSFPAKWWDHLSMAANTVGKIPGGHFGIFDGDFKTITVYSENGEIVGYARKMPKDLKEKFSDWEHGTTIEAIESEIAHKREIIKKEIEEKKLSERSERAARLLARIGTKTMINYQDARDVGACHAGIMAFGAKIGVVDQNAEVPLATIAKTDPEWAVRIARKIYQKTKIANQGA